MSDIVKPVVEAQMLIRKPAEEVFKAFIDPSITTNFWFTRGSDALEAGKTVTWEWEMYAVSTTVFVREIVPNTKIKIEWDEPVTTVEFEFTPVTPDTTYVSIRNFGFDLQGDALIAAVMDSTGGFTTVLDGLKAYLEHGINLNLIGDKFPSAVTRQGNQ